VVDGGVGVVEDVVFSNCTAYNPQDDLVNGIAAININCPDGGRVERIQFHNMSSRNLRAAFYLYVGKRHCHQAAYRTPSVGTLRDVIISQFQGEGCVLPSFATGHPDSAIQGVTFDNLRLRGSFVRATQTSDTLKVPELPDAYPDSRMYGDLPCHGIYLRHIDGLHLHNLQVENTTPGDSRPALWCEQVTYPASMEATIRERSD